MGAHSGVETAVPTRSGEGSPARTELHRLVGSGSPDRQLLAHRLLVFAGIGAALAALHLVAPGGAEHVALTALFASLVPVFAPLCFVPVAFERRRPAAGRAVIAVRLAAVTVLGWCVAGMHLIVWLVLAELTGSIGPPGVGDVPFVALTVLVTAAVVGTAYSLPRSDRLVRSTATGSSIVVYAGAFFVHGQLLAPSMTAVKAHFSGMPAVTETGGAALALLGVALLLRRELGGGPQEAPGSAPAAGEATA